VYANNAFSIIIAFILYHDLLITDGCGKNNYCVFIYSRKKNKEHCIGKEQSFDTDAYAATIALTVYCAGKMETELLTNDEENKNIDINKIYKCYPEKDICNTMKIIISNEKTLQRSLILSKLLWLCIFTGEQNTLISLKYIQSQIDEKEDYLIEEINDVLKYANEKDHYKVCTSNDDGFGIACPMPGSFKSSLHTIITYGQNGEYKDSVLQEISSGGDNAARSVITGSIIGSIGTIQKIPEKYVNNTLASKNVLKWILDLINASSK